MESKTGTDRRSHRELVKINYYISVHGQTHFIVSLVVGRVDDAKVTNDQTFILMFDIVLVCCCWILEIPDKRKIISSFSN